MKVTEEKRITGTIIKIGRSEPHSTSWGNFLFNAREVSVQLPQGTSQQTLTMYLCRDSWLNEMKIPPEAFIGKPVSLAVHGLAYEGSRWGHLIIDRIEPLYKQTSYVDLTAYFDYDWREDN